MSEERDPRVVYVAKDLNQAELLASWLGERGFKCEVNLPEHPAEPPDGIGLTPHDPPGIEVRVIDVDQAAAAREAFEGFLAATRAREELRRKRAEAADTVDAVCEECGAASKWPAIDMGTTQECPNCGRYMDVPDPEDDWSDVDFGAPEGETEEAPPEEKP